MAIDSITATTPLTTSLVQHFTDVMVTEIGVWEDTNSISIGCWHDLHPYLDTNELTEAAGVPWGADIATEADPAGTRWILAVEHRVDAIIHEAADTTPCGLMTQPDAYGTEQITGVANDWWICVPGCDNRPDTSGFYAADSEGNIIEPDETNWDGVTYVCADCGRLIDVNTGVVIGQRTAAATAAHDREWE